jgi:hypothetical protein
MMLQSRRELLATAGLVTGSGLLGSAIAGEKGEARREAARRLPVDDPRFALRTWARLNGDPSGGVTYSFLQGMVYGFLPQSDDVRLAEFVRPLYQYRTCTARRMRFEADGTLRIRTRTWNYYANSVTGTLHREFTNPYTGKLVQCPPRASNAEERTMTAGPPASGSPGPFPVESSLDGHPMKLDYAVLAGDVWIKREQFTRFHPSDTTWFKLEADFVTHAARLEDVRNGRPDHVRNTISHNLVAEWQTWMNMHGSPGHILFIGAGGHVRHAGELPDSFVATIEHEFPRTLGDALAWS